MRGLIRTVLGDIDPTQLGRLNYHEHLFQKSPLLPGEDLDDEDASGREAKALRLSGFDAMVDATPLGLGRRPVPISLISETSGLSVVMTTGMHRREHYASSHPLLDLSAEQLAAAFVQDLTVGAMEPWERTLHSSAPVVAQLPKAGVLKAAAGYWRIDHHTARALHAVGSAHASTGAPVMVHTEYGTAAFEVIAVLEREGVPASRVALAHMDRNPDAGLHGELAATGAYLGYDGAARAREWPDSVLIECLLRTLEGGGGDNILIGGDVARASRYRSYGGMPGLQYLGDHFVPRVVAAVGVKSADRILRVNGARWLRWQN